MFILSVAAKNLTELRAGSAKSLTRGKLREGGSGESMRDCPPTDMQPKRIPLNQRNNQSCSAYRLVQSEREEARIRIYLGNLEFASKSI